MSTEVPSKPRPIEQAKLLLGEGFEEVLFFEAFLKHLGISGVQVEDCKGKSNLRAYLKALRTRTGFSGLQVLGVTRDADDEPVAAAASIADAITNAQFPASLKVATFILPGAGLAGALEDLCFNALAGQPVETCVHDYFVCVDRVTSRTSPAGTRLAKARIHAWLAAQEEPDLRLGQAAVQGLIDWSKPAFDELRRFLTDLFR
ncbi:MAG: hypothetical protein HYY24_26010 [Verrucomicrobia bacterium]|nr:hypothetical protein [Verrucomicrobiota bacterium]